MLILAPAVEVTVSRQRFGGVRGRVSRGAERAADSVRGELVEPPHRRPFDELRANGIEG